MKETITIFALIAIAILSVANISAGATDVKNSGLATDLVSYWEMEETSNTRVDSHGANDLTDNNPVTYATGILGNAAAFLASGLDFLSNTTAIGYAEGAPLSYNLWVYLPSTSQKGVFVEDSAIVNSNSGFAIGVGNNDLDTAGNDLMIPLWGYTWQDTDVAIGTGWHMITVIYGTDRKTKAYKDGSLVFTGTTAGGAMSDADFFIGKSQGPTARYLSDGYIDEVGVWSRALTADEIVELYNAGDGIPYEVATPPASSATPDSDAIIFE
jgi:hypothetical protein